MKLSEGFVYLVLFGLTKFWHVQKLTGNGELQDWRQSRVKRARFLRRLGSKGRVQTTEE